MGFFKVGFVENYGLRGHWNNLETKNIYWTIIRVRKYKIKIPKMTLLRKRPSPQFSREEVVFRKRRRGRQRLEVVSISCCAASKRACWLSQALHNGF